MEIVDSIANLLGISGAQAMTIGVMALGLIIVWAVLRTVLRVAFRVFALGCVTIIGVIVGLYVLFVLIR